MTSSLAIHGLLSLTPAKDRLLAPFGQENGERKNEHFLAITL